jgi:hypothetical protein
MLMPRIAVSCSRSCSAGGAPPRLALLQLRGAPGQVVSLASRSSPPESDSRDGDRSRRSISLDAWLERVLPADLHVRAGAGDTAYLGATHQARLLPCGVRRAEFQRE